MLSKNIIKQIYKNIHITEQINQSNDIIKYIVKENILQNYKNIGIFCSYKTEPIITQIIHKYKEKKFYIDYDNHYNKLDLLFITGYAFDKNNYIICNEKYDKSKIENIKTIGIFYKQQRVIDGLELSKYKNDADIMKLDLIITS